jgi:hypothetical protein
MRRLVVAIAIAVAALWVVPAQAADNLIPTKILIVKPGKLSKFLAKPVSPATFALPAGANSPLVKDWGIWGNVFDLWLHITPLASVQWKGLGNPPGLKGYKYKGAGTLADPCKVILIKEKIIKAVCKGDLFPGAPPYGSDELPVQIAADDLSERYCAEAGNGTNIKDTATIFKEKDSPAPVLCQSPSGAFVDDSSGTF